MSPDLRAAIVQDAETNRVLMLAWMDDEALGSRARRARRTSSAARGSASGARARRRATRSRWRSFATTATATRSSSAFDPPGRRATPARCRASRRGSGAASPIARGSDPRARTWRARRRRPGRSRAQGRRGGRRGRAGRCLRERRAARGGGRGSLVPLLRPARRAWPRPEPRRGRARPASYTVMTILPRGWPSPMCRSASAILLERIRAVDRGPELRVRQEVSQRLHVRLVELREEERRLLASAERSET